MRCCAEDKKALLLEIYYVLNKQWRFTLTDSSFYRSKAFQKSNKSCFVENSSLCQLAFT